MSREKNESTWFSSTSLEENKTSRVLDFILSEPIRKQVEMLVTARVSQSYTIIETDDWKAQGLPDIHALKENDRIIIEIKSWWVWNSHQQIWKKLKRKRDKFPWLTWYVLIFKEILEEESWNLFCDQFDEVKYDTKFHRHKCVSYNFWVFDIKELFNRWVRSEIISWKEIITSQQLYSKSNFIQTSSEGLHL